MTGEQILFGLLISVIIPFISYVMDEASEYEKKGQPCRCSSCTQKPIEPPVKQLTREERLELENKQLRAKLKEYEPVETILTFRE